VIEDLRELALGEWEGLTVDHVVERYGDHYWRWLAAPADHPPPGGEAMPLVMARAGRVVEILRARHPEGSVAAVTHGGVIACFLAHLLALGPNAVWRLRIENTSITRVAWPGGRLLALNDTAHLGTAP
jgi:broad specificity phosphatase PhoE